VPITSFPVVGKRRQSWSVLISTPLHGLGSVCSRDGVRSRHKLGVVVHSCNPSYSGDGQRWGRPRFSASLGKMLARPHLYL
jgi:hypothetical protein